MRSLSRLLALLAAIVALAATLFLGFELTLGGRTVLVPTTAPTGPIPTEFVPTPTPLPTPTATPMPTATPAPSPTPTAAASTVVCHGEPLPLPTLLRRDPCTDAIQAVQLAVAAIGRPIQRIVIEPGPFHCDQPFPATASPVTCYMPTVRPGQFMHAWVSFTDTSSVAAVMLGLDLPDDIEAPGATISPWRTTLVTFEEPQRPG